MSCVFYAIEVGVVQGDGVELVSSMHIPPDPPPPDTPEIYCKNALLLLV